MLKKLKEKLSKKENNIIQIGCPIEGEVVSIKEVNDPTFSQEMLGKGIAIKPNKGRVVAPIDGEIAMIFETKHAVSILTEQGAEILIHIGLDTVKLKGENFISHVKAGDKVKAGDLLIEFDKEKIIQAGYDTITPMVICNSFEYAQVNQTTLGDIQELTSVIEIIK